MQVEMVNPRFGGGTITTTPKAQRLADAIVHYETDVANNVGDTITVYEIVQKYGLADILGTYSYTGRKPTNVADQVVRNAINEEVKRQDGGLWPTGARRKGYSVFQVIA